MQTHYKLASRIRSVRQSKEFKTKAKLWVYSGAAASWHFLTLPKSLSDQIKKEFGGVARGWGSIRVKAVIGGSEWATSIFQDKKRGAYLLPIKASIRKAENLKEAQFVPVKLSI